MTEKEKLLALVHQYQILEDAADKAWLPHLANYYARLGYEAQLAYDKLEEQEWKRFQYAQKFV